MEKGTIAPDFGKVYQKGSSDTPKSKKSSAKIQTPLKTEETSDDTFRSPNKLNDMYAAFKIYGSEFDPLKLRVE